jgi:hypothetical protein
MAKSSLSEKVKKNPLKLALQIGLPLICGWFLFDRLKSTSWELPESAFSLQIGILSLCILMTCGVWATDTMLWRLFLPEKIKIPLIQLISKNISASSTGFFTPVQLGEYYGKRKLIQSLSRTESLASTFFYRMAKVTVKFLMGFVALSVLTSSHHQLNTFAFPLLILSLLLLIAALFPDKLGLNQFIGRWVNKFAGTLIVPKRFLKFRLQALFLASVKILLNTAQFLLIYSLWSFDFLEIIPGVILLYTIASFVPTVGILDPIIKSSLSIIIISPDIQADLPVMLATTLVWLLNVGLPALIGSLFFTRALSNNFHA